MKNSAPKTSYSSTAITATPTMTQAPALVTLDNTLSQEQHDSIKAAQNLHNHLVLDLSNTVFMDAFGLSCILTINRELEQKGFSVALVNPQPAIRTLLFFTKIYHLLPSFPNLQQANQHLGRTVVESAARHATQPALN